jgi:HAD superfamily hydrolase (TIGR01493 family)
MAKAIVFDLWNTLAYNDSKEVPIFHLERKFGLKMEDYKKIERAFMMQKFPSVLDAAKHICEFMGKEPTNEIIRDLLDIWDLTRIHFALFPDTIPVLEELGKKYKLALISNTDCFTMKPFFEAGYKKYFNYIAFSYETCMLKPDPKLFRLVLRNLGVKPEEAVMVGDNLHDDVQAAENVDMQAVLIKRDPKEFKFVPSWVEKGTYEKTISSLKELEKSL